jgi:integrase
VSLLLSLLGMIMTTLKWTDYPKPNLRLIRGVWTVEVNIPASMRHLFGNGNGMTRNRRKSTQTIDKSLAQAKMHELTHQIYSEFDKKQDDHLTRHHVVTDNFASDTIIGLATSFNYKNLPKLKPSTNYDQLFTLKTACDVYAEMIANCATINEIKVMADVLATSASPEEVLAKWKETQVSSPYSTAQKGLAGRYKTSMIHTYWQDLFIEAAREQGLPEPIIEPFEGAHVPVVLIEGTVQPDHPIFRHLTNLPVEPINRPARVVPKGPLMLSDVQEEYFKIIDRDYDKADTKRALKRGVIKFVNLIGDLPIHEVDLTTAYAFIDKQLEQKPDTSHSLIKDTNWTMSKLYSFLMKRGYVKNNPFVGLDLKTYGTKTKSFLPYTSEELFTIFKHNWEPQERLLLSIMITTGMRLNEAGTLTWDRFNDTEFQGIRYFSLLDTNEEMVATKNVGSKRIIPLHPDLVLPPKGTGRLFDYKIYEGHSCAIKAGNAINPTLNELVPHPRKSAHSFRSSLKILLRDADVSKEVNDYYTGHSSGDAAGKSYGGIGVVKRYEDISKARHPWLLKTDILRRQ